MISSFMFGLTIIIEYHDTNDKLTYRIWIIILFNKNRLCATKNFSLSLYFRPVFQANDLKLRMETQNIGLTKVKTG